MAQSRLIELSYFDPHTSIRLTTYADTIVTDYSSPNRIISAVRFGGYPEVVKAMSDAIYGGATIDVCSNGETLHLDTVPKGYRRQLSHDGIYAAATLMANDDPQSPDQLKEDAAEDDSTEENKPRKCYIFCPAGDQDRLFEEVDRKTAAPLIPEFRDYVLRELIRRGELRRMEVFSVKEKMDAWVLSLLPEDKNVVQVLEDGLKTGQIAIPGATPGAPDGFAQVENVTSYLSTYGITVADRIRKQFIPLFDPASEPLSDEVLAINRYIQQKAGYSLYDAQLAVAEATKRQLQRCGTALIVAECGSGKTKIGTDALGALYGLGAAQGGKKTFNLVMAPSHVTKKWVREIGETLPNTFAMVVKSITDLNRLYDMYQNCPQSVFAVFSKERARDGYMRYPAVQWNRRKKAFLCPDCMEPVEMEISEDGTRYTVNADQFFFQKEHKRNHKCRRCGAVLWAPVVPGRQIDWIKIPEYGWIYRYRAGKHLMRTQNEAVLDQLIHVTPYIGYGQGRDITARPMQEMKVVNVHACPEGVIYSGLIKVERETFYIEEVKDALLYSQEEWEALLPELEAEPSPLLFRSSFKAQLPPQPVERYYVLAEECGFFGEKKELHLLAASASVDLLKDQISREIARLTTADLLSVGAAFMPLEVESPESEDYSYRYIEIGGSLTYYISPVPVLAMEAISPREQGSGAEGHIS